MARQASAARLGYYPAAPEAIALIASRLRSDKPATILDPCAGEGLALEQLSTALGCRPQDVYAVELDDARARELKARLPQAKILAPCSFFGTTSSRGVFSCVYCNPPFDDEIGGGGRTEHEFVRRATELLQPGGVLVLVCPEAVAEHWRFEELLATWYNAATRFPFPDEVRRFNETVTICVRRDKPARADFELQSERVYDLPPARSIPLWAKTMLTDAELSEALAASPLRKILAAPPDDPLPSPPLALAQGHVALLLASGHLDGIVRPPNEEPHVVRGRATKREYIASVEESEDDEGRTTTKTIKKEKPELCVRVLTADGIITTLGEEVSDEDTPEDSSECD